MNMKLGCAYSMIYAPWVETSTFATSSMRRQRSLWRGISTISCTYSNRAISSDGGGGDLGEIVEVERNLLFFSLFLEGCSVCDLMGH